MAISQALINAMKAKISRHKEKKAIYAAKAQQSSNPAVAMAAAKVEIDLLPPIEAVVEEAEAVVEGAIAEAKIK